MYSNLSKEILVPQLEPGSPTLNPEEKWRDNIELQNAKKQDST